MSIVDDVAAVAASRGAKATLRARDGEVRLTFPNGSVQTLTLAKAQSEASRLRGRPVPERHDWNAPRVYRWDGPL